MQYNPAIAVPGSRFATLLLVLIAVPVYSQDWSRLLAGAGKQAAGIIEDSIRANRSLAGFPGTSSLLKQKKTLLCAEVLQAGPFFPGPVNTGFWPAQQLKSFAPEMIIYLRNQARAAVNIDQPASFPGIPLSTLRETGRHITHLWQPLTSSLFESAHVSSADEGMLTAGQQFNHLHTTKITTGVMGIPLAFTLSHASPAASLPGNSLIFVAFNRQAFVKRIQQQTGIRTAADFSGLLAAAGRKLHAALDNAMSGLAGRLQGSYSKLLKNELDLLKSKMTIPAGSLKSLEIRLQYVYDSLLATYKKQPLNSLEKIAANDGQRRPEMDTLLVALKKLRDLLPAITRLQQRFDGVSGSLLPLVSRGQVEANKWLGNSPETGTPEAAVHLLPLTAWQKLFTHVSSLNAGTAVVSVSPLTVWHFTSTGLNLSLNSRHFYLFLLAAKPGNPTRETFIPGTGKNTGGLAIGTRMGSGSLAGNHHHFSVFRYSQADGLPGGWPAIFVPGNTTVIAYSHKRQFGERGWITAEMARSNHVFPAQGKAYYPRERNSPDREEGPRFIDQVAYTLDVTNSVEGSRLGYAFHVSRTGKAFYNPGNLFMQAGTTVLTASLRNSALRGRLFFTANAGYSRQEGAAGTGWNRLLLSLRTRLAFAKGQYLAVSWSPSLTNGRGFDGYARAGYGNGISVDGSFRRRFGRLNYQHTIGLVLAPNAGIGMEAFDNRSYSFSSTQVMSTGNRDYYLTVQAGTGLQAAMPCPVAVLAGDAGCSYRLGKWITGSSAISLNKRGGLFTGGSIKQTIGGQLGSRLSMMVYASVCKTLRGQPDFFCETSGGRWTFAYILK